MIRLAVYGHTGSGKSTVAAMVRKHFESKGLTVEVLKLAQPLYELQQQFYRIAGQPIPFFAQDQGLLEAIAAHLRRISPTSLVDDFLLRLSSLKVDVIINDDLRDLETDYRILREQGFKMVYVTCTNEVRAQRLAHRNDLSTELNSATTAEINMFEPDVLIDNSGSDLGDLQRKIDTALETLR